MITAEMRAEIRRLVLRDEWKIETVARRFGVHHSVVRRTIRTECATETAPVAPTALEPFKHYIVERLTAHPELTSTRLVLELRNKRFTGGVAILRRYVAKVRAPRSKKAYLRIETEPAEVAQVDWGSFGILRIGTTQRPLTAFVMVLKWSRALFVDFSLDMRMDTFLRMHQRAFAYFGGVTQRVIYDNLKSVVLHHIGTTVQFNPAFLSFAGHMLFEPVAAPVRYPQAKGNVENAIKYLRSSFFYGRSFRNLQDVRDQVARWRDEVPIPVFTPLPASVLPIASCSRRPASARSPSTPSTPISSCPSSSPRRPASTSTPTPIPSLTPWSDAPLPSVPTTLPSASSTPASPSPSTPVRGTAAAPSKTKRTSTPCSSVAPALAVRASTIASRHSRPKLACSRARCLTCGEVATDNYKWQPP